MKTNSLKLTANAVLAISLGAIYFAQMASIVPLPESEEPRMSAASDSLRKKVKPLDPDEQDTIDIDKNEFDFMVVSLVLLCQLGEAGKFPEDIAENLEEGVEYLLDQFDNMNWANEEEKSNEDE